MHVMICGLEGRFRSRLQIIRDVIGLAPGVTELAAMTLMITNKGVFFLADTHVNQEPNLDQIVDIALRAATEVKRFGIAPKIALISHSDFGSHDSVSARKMRKPRVWHRRAGAGSGGRRRNAGGFRHSPRSSASACCPTRASLVSRIS